MNTDRLLAWINTHDCGVSPCGVKRDDGAIEIRIALCHSDDHETYVVRTLTEARNALGY